MGSPAFIDPSEVARPGPPHPRSAAAKSGPLGRVMEADLSKKSLLGRMDQIVPGQFKLFGVNEILKEAYGLDTHCKKRLAVTKPPLAGNNLIITGQGGFGKSHPGWRRENP